MNTVQKPCLICRRKFKRDKFHPHQKICFRNDCRREHKKRLLKKWRNNHPDYFKDLNRLLKKDTREACRRWRKNNSGYYRDYRRRYSQGEKSEDKGPLVHQGTSALVEKKLKINKDKCKQQKLAQGA